MRSALPPTAHSPASNRLHQTRPRILQECSSLAPDCSAACTTTLGMLTACQKRHLNREAGSLLISTYEAMYLPPCLSLQMGPSLDRHPQRQMPT